ncbi:hypothetical protein A1OE_364 [Candidatus Endolissoclinum faulkneri L2]|uniref:Uncharacterized protein n=1 Tax=Candidatus Endolissoclinum faulkneri L2 TaxID=1193729 RepID=K7YPR1_9PROT|nr:hypothetical protein A1OE_364 [Candidatus Endolissoclinum faulkneri L2]
MIIYQRISFLLQFNEFNQYKQAIAAIIIKNYCFVIIAA